MAAEANRMQRLEMTLDGGPSAQSVRVDEKTGDVAFLAVAVDRNQQPNRKGFLFDWDSPEDVKVAAWQANPVLLYRHDDFMIPIGWVEEIGRDMQRVTARCRVPNLAGDPDMARYDGEVVAPVRGAIRNGLLKAVSIGFYILRAEDVNLPDGGKAVKVKSFEVVELSVCSIGAHETALIQQSAAADAPSVALFAERAVGRWRAARADGLAEAELLQGLRQETGGPSGGLAEAKLLQGRRQATPQADGRTLYCLRAGGPEPVEGAADPADAMRKLGHHAGGGSPGLRTETLHSPDGECQAAPPGRPDADALRGAMAKVLGARGGLPGMSDAQRRTAHEHLARHYAELGRQAPAWKPDYAPEELNALHDAGAILIPGRPPVAGRPEQGPCPRLGEPPVCTVDAGPGAPRPLGPPAPGRPCGRSGACGVDADAALRWLEAAVGQAVHSLLAEQSALLELIRAGVDSAIVDYVEHRRSNHGR
jgi:phage head maturation protease